MNRQQLIAFLKDNTFETIGCTDPISITLATAWAAKNISGELKSISLSLSPNIIKNAYSVKIPGVFKAGIELASAIGYVISDPSQGLKIIEGISPEVLVKSEEISGKGIISYSSADTDESVYIEAEVKTNLGTSTAVIKGKHDKLVSLKVNGECRFSLDGNTAATYDIASLLTDFIGFDQIIDIVKEIHSEELEFLYEGIEKNLNAARYYYDCINSEIAYEPMDDIILEIRRSTSYASLARMSGATIPIIGCFGSGNHGITLFIAVGLLGKKLNKSREEILRALAIGELLTGYIKSRTGILTPHCGCSLAASVGAAAGCAYLLGGGGRQIENAVNIVISTLFGTICDGAKEACSLKITNAAGVAVESAYASVRQRIELENQGVIGATFSDTLRNIKLLTERGFHGLDNQLIQIFKM
ncbi:MAG TPA: L-serine ammonia-lyase, iron-sulfur-dependent, subunit alpha [Clostridia bacterium]|nr:L-serine ammonia-lyase, iron-sulfur-dependent, subunit alpha [Bacillota bacterium]HRS20692.1 L-serine ammonia-lyase, iron-sulfur-dependent, subunit alpha [Clostridia bacterium]HRU41609.1 L-serine ammonia-lyase, iron-sulfur-dependent, subunit alpha [Candidatus Diapherotrites archaeon]